MGKKVIRKSTLTGLILMGIIASGCRGIGALPGAGQNGPATTIPPAAPTDTAIPASAATSTPAGLATSTAAASPLISHCTLLDSHDIAALFTGHRTEVMLPQQEDSQVDHPVFSSVKASGNENACIFYGFINPDVKTMSLLQITYWIDVPDPSANDSWDQAWAGLKSAGGSSVPGVGESAYFYNGRLTLKQSGVYITIEATGQALNAFTPTGTDPKLDVEKQLALDILAKLNPG
jgi:hypothetical protein